MIEQWIVIPRWDEFQHRDAARSNVPTWIKAFTRLLSDDAYLELTLHQRGVLHGLWLEYARARRQLRGSTSALSRRLGQRITTRDLEALSHAGFVEFSASKPARNDASSSARTEERREEPPTPLRGNDQTHRTTRRSSQPDETHLRGQHKCPHCPLHAISHSALADHIELAHPTAGEAAVVALAVDERPPIDETLIPYDLDMGDLHHRLANAQPDHYTTEEDT